ncbi:hypothetical protein MTO96_031527 [Rhipicephalus appendiculatus]
MDSLLGDKPRRFLTGPQMTLADVALKESLTLPKIMNYDLSPFPSVKTWYEWMEARLSTVNEINVEGIEQFRACIGMQ